MRLGDCEPDNGKECGPGTQVQEVVCINSDGKKDYLSSFYFMVVLFGPGEILFLVLKYHVFSQHSWFCLQTQKQLPLPSFLLSFLFLLFLSFIFSDGGCGEGL